MKKFIFKSGDQPDYPTDPGGDGGYTSNGDSAT